MKTGFEGLDKIINLEDPQLILLTGTHFIEELSGDIANNVCLKQECEVLEVVSCKKEYLIKRMLVNEADVNYKSWTLKDKYSDKELQQIGQATVNLIEVTKRLPIIIEQDFNLYNLKEVVKLVSDFANHYADRGITANTLVVLDIVPLNSQHKGRYRKQILKLIKDLKKISIKLRYPIIFIDNIDISKKHNTDNNTCNYLTKEHIDNINKINKYVDTFIIVNSDNEQRDIFNVDVYDTKAKIGTCKLKYDFRCRKFEDYNNI